MARLLIGTNSNKKHNKNMHSDKIKLRSFLTTLYFAGDVGVSHKKEIK